MIADRSQTASHIGLRRHDLGATPIAVSPETERVTALTSVQGTGCGTGGVAVALNGAVIELVRSQA